MKKAAKAPSQTDIIDEFNTAAWQNDVDIIDDLAKKHPWLVNPSNPHLLAALHTACGSCQLHSATLLVEKYHADVNRRSTRGMNALHEAMGAADIRTARMLIKNGADVNAVDTSNEGYTDGWTPLHYAVSHTDPVMVQELIEQGANPRAKNAKGQTPADMARANKRPAVAAFLDSLTPPVSETKLLLKRPPTGPKAS